jgi:hypothetical protein
MTASCATRALLFALFSSTLLACQSVPGDACEQSGDGFQSQDTCRAYGADGRCLSFPITCPDGSETTPFICEGAECAVDDDCETDWVCAGTGSVTKNCVPASVCE